MILLYNLLLSILLIFAWPYLLIKYVKNPDGWRERFGDYPRFDGRILWIHAVSVGEVTAVSSLVNKFKKECPWYTLIVTTFTQTGKLRARQLYGDKTFYAPLDFRFCIRRALSRIHPEVLILVETELWPNLITMARRKGCRVFLVNGRITSKSLKRYRTLNGFMTPILRNFSHFMVQSAEHAERLKILGGEPEKISVIGNLKSDLVGDIPSRESMRIELGLEPSNEVIVAGSTREGEEEMILEALKPLKDKIILILVPRHLERISKLEQLITDYGFTFWKRTEGNTHKGDILLVDTIGELASIYGAADIAFIGGSFLPYGGHNPLEAAVYSIPVLFGPYMENAGGKRLKECGGGIEVKSAIELRKTINYLLRNPEEKLQRGILAKRALEEVKGASERAFSIISKELDAHKAASKTFG